MIPFRIIRKRIGDLLIERNIITQKQLNLACEEQRKKGGYLSQHLISLGLVSEIDIATCLSTQYNFAYLPLKNYSISAEILELIPLKWIKVYTLLPVDKMGDTLSVAMADPLNEGVIQMLHQLTNCDIEVFISTYSELNEAINKYFGGRLSDLKEACLDISVLRKIKTAGNFIQTKKYTGPERREYVRISKNLGISYYFHGRTFQAETKDISYSGVSFISPVIVSADTNLTCKIYLKEGCPPIDAIINIGRAQLKTGTEDAAAIEPESSFGQDFEVAGGFEFIMGDDRAALVDFLKEKVCSIE